MNKNTIILDLGGVILPLNTSATREDFLSLTKKDINEWMKFSYPHEIIQQFELGKISEDEFFQKLKEILQFNKDPRYLKEAWNKMLLPIPKENIQFLKALSEKYNLIILSNTCETHIECFEKMLQQYHNITNLEQLVDKVYLSCRINMRKPDLSIFEKVIKDNELNPRNTFYFDDTEEHINAAKQLGIRTMLYPRNELLSKVLKEFLYVPQKTDTYSSLC